jgi:hypothetical protein
MQWTRYMHHMDVCGMGLYHEDTSGSKDIDAASDVRRSQAKPSQVPVHGRCALGRVNCNTQNCRTAERRTSGQEGFARRRPPSRGPDPGLSEMVFRA